MPIKTRKRRVSATKTGTTTTDPTSQILKSLTQPAYELSNYNDSLDESELPDEESFVEANQSVKYKSSFFFKLDDSSLERKRREALSKKKELPSSTREIDKIAESYKEVLPKDMESRIEEVRDFFLSELSPLVLAANVGCEQAMSILDITTEGQVDKDPQRKFNEMLMKGLQLRMSRFIVEYLGLDKKDYLRLLRNKKPNPRQQAISIFPPLEDVHPDRPVPRKKR